MGKGPEQPGVTWNYLCGDLQSLLKAVFVSYTALVQDQLSSVLSVECSSNSSLEIILYRFLSPFFCKSSVRWIDEHQQNTLSLGWKKIQLQHDWIGICPDTVQLVLWSIECSHSEKINLSLQVQEFSGANKEKLEETIKSLV